MDQLHICVATTFPKMMFAKALISFAFFCPKLVIKHRLCSKGDDKINRSHHGGSNFGDGGDNYDSCRRGTAVGRNKGNKRKRDGDSSAGNIASGSIINTAGRNI